MRLSDPYPTMHSIGKPSTRYISGVKKWMPPGRYVTGPELAEAGLAGMIDLAALVPSKK